MKTWKLVVPATLLLLLAGQVAAQTETEQRQVEAEAREVEVEERLRAAEAAMEEAARTIVEITEERLPRIARFEHRFAMGNKPRLGVTIESGTASGPVEGVTLLGVSPGSAASDAGLRAGDVLTSVNSESLSAANGVEANRRLLGFMKGVEEGDVLKVEYLREGKVGAVEVEPRPLAPKALVFAGHGPHGVRVPPVHVSPEALKDWKMDFSFPWAGTALGDIELVELSERLGRYFGTDKGLLVVRAPQSGALQLEDGDVIQSIDGREPKDARHAMRILSSYQGGEKLELGIMRDGKKRKLEVEIAADYQGRLDAPLDFNADVDALPPASGTS